MTLAEQYPLPDINNSALVRAVFTHKSMAGRPAGLVHVDEPGDDNESLAFLGDTVISLVVSAVLCSNLPLSRPGDLTDKRKLLVNQDRLASWADAYDLPSHLRAHQSAEILLRHNTGTKAKLFQAYIGALFLQTDRNYRAVEDWFGQLVEQGLEDIKSFENAAEILTERLQSLKMNEPAEDQPPPAQVPSSSPSPSGSSSGSSRAPAQVPPSSPSPSNSSRSSSSNASYPTQLGRLALFNQLCSQKHIRPDWQCSSLGASHRPSHRATVRLSPTSDIIGTGVAGKKKEAQEKAAEEAMEKLGWVEL